VFILKWNLSLTYGYKREKTLIWIRSGWSLYSPETCSWSFGQYKWNEVIMAESGKHTNDKRFKSFAISNAWLAKGWTTNAKTGEDVEVEHKEHNDLQKDGMDWAVANSISKTKSCGKLVCLLEGGKCSLWMKEETQVIWGWQG